MTQKILVALGITTIAIMLLAWGYLLLFGTPGGVNDVFTDLGLRNGSTPITVQTDLSPTTNLAPVTTKLVQLSTKAVIGFVYTEATEASTSTEAKSARLRYAERGTGHVYEIDFGTNTETRVSGTTVAKAVAAIFNDEGEVAVIVAEDTDGTSATLQVFGAISNESTPLSDNADNFHFISTDKLRYTVVENNETVAYELDWKKGTTASLWRVPLTDINVEWTDRDALIINKPAGWLRSGVYSVDNGTLSRMVAPEYAFSAKADPSGRFIIFSHFNNELGLSINQTLDRENNTTATSALTAIPEKCTFASPDFWCASSFETTSANQDVLNDWYRGEFTASDILWQGRTDGSAVYIDDLSGLAGFDIDVTYLTATEDNQLFFINKTNNTLWVYKIDQE